MQRWGKYCKLVIGIGEITITIISFLIKYVEIGKTFFIIIIIEIFTLVISGTVINIY